MEFNKANDCEILVQIFNARLPGRQMQLYFYFLVKAKPHLPHPPPPPHTFIGLGVMDERARFLL